VAQPLSPHQVERVIGLLRVFGLLAGLLLVALSDFPNSAMRLSAWATLALLSVASAGIWLWGQRTRWSGRGIVHVGFILDVVLVTGYAVSFAHIHPNVSWSVAFTVLADATIRYGVRGAVIGYLLAVLVYGLQARAHEAVTGEPTGALGTVYVLSTLFGVAGVLALFSHLLQRRAAEQGLQALALADALELQERGVAAASHEFRGALTVILGAARTAREKRERLGSQRLDSLLEDIEAQGRHIQDLLDRLVAGGTDRTGGIAIRPRSGDVADTIHRAVEAAERHKANHDVTLDLSSIVCTLDHERLQQVVRNLVENAFKHTTSGSRVKVAARRLGVIVEVRVVDNGPGIDLSVQRRAFDPFQHRNGDGPDTEPSGLGLYLVRQIITAMGGTMELRSSSAGSDFALRVPVASFASGPEVRG
jgi:signal transduction histidine kinase